jgi:hypothetical protein
MSDLNSANLEKVQAQNHKTDTSAATKLSQEAQEAQRAKTPSLAKPAGSDSPHVTSAPAANATAKAKDLPNLTLVHTPAPAKSDWFSSIAQSAEGVMHVAGDLGKGAVDEAIHHPGTLLKDAAIGVAAGAATAVGIALLPEGLAGLAIVGGVAAIGGAAVGAYEVVKHGGIQNTAKAVVDGAKDLVHQAENLGHNVAVDFDRSKYSAADQQKAEKAVQKVGGVGAEVAAGTLGTVVGSGGALLIKGAISAASAEAAAGAPAAVAVDASLGGAPAASAAEAPLASGPAAAAAESAPSEVTQLVTGDAQATSVADAAANEAALQAKVTAEFGPLNETDQAFAMNLAKQAESGGYKSIAFYAATNLKDPTQIAEFARVYAGDSDVALNNMKFAVNSGRVMDGTATAWKAAIAKIETPSISEVAKQAALRATVSSEFGSLNAKDQTFAMSLAEKAAAEGYKSPSYYAAQNLTDPAEIDQFARIYAAAYKVGLHNMNFMVESGRIMDGTEAAWKAAIAKITPTD